MDSNACFFQYIIFLIYIVQNFGSLPAFFRNIRSNNVFINLRVLCCSFLGQNIEINYGLIFIQTISYMSAQLMLLYNDSMHYK